MFRSGIDPIGLPAGPSHANLGSWNGSRNFSRGMSYVLHILQLPQDKTLLLRLRWLGSWRRRRRLVASRLGSLTSLPRPFLIGYCIGIGSGRSVSSENRQQARPRPGSVDT